VGSFLLFFPVIILKTKSQQEEVTGINLGLALAFAVSLSILFRTLGSSIDISTYSWGQIIGWILATIASFMLIGLYFTERDAKTSEKAPETGLPSSNEVSIHEHPDRIWRIVGFTFGLTSILIMIYFAFNSPTVISRWTEGDYFLLTMTIMLLISISVLVILFIPHKMTMNINTNQGILFIGIIHVILVVWWLYVIVVNQTFFPSSIQSYPVYASSDSIFDTLLIMLFFLLLIFTDFTLFSRELIKTRPTNFELGIAFTFTSFYFLLMIFANVFTTTYDYIPVVGPFFRDKIWLVFLIIGFGISIPIFFIKKSTLSFKKPSIKLQTRIIATIMIIITIGTIFGTFIISPSPSPKTTTSLKVLTYNIQQGYNEHGIKNFEGQLNLLKDIDADIIGLQESDLARISGGNSDIVRYFANHLNLYSYYGPKTVTGTFGIALLSKFPIKNARTFYMYSDGEQTAAIEAQIHVGNIIFNILVTHLGNDGPIIQQEAIMDTVFTKTNVILMGDFNYRANTTQYNLTTTILQDSWLLAETKQIEYLDDQEFNLSQRIDFIFVSPGITVSECQYVISFESDHPALWVGVEL
jgi:endonuclease/exonuclease/phosphatase family metal-dependent hydrolase